ncbi:helix-turn-helix domain-containing protein [Intestinimonas sp.]|uniref:helix-turn-helix domain-containing protein n=1 Tax=Intestinimonas sp. TaxID=1965293 RepID=UPI003AB4BF3F
MWTLYESILSLCSERGIRGGKMCVDLGLSKSLMTDLKSGRKKGITAETAQKIAEYFGVSVDRVLSGPDTEKAPSENGEGKVDEADLKAAFWGGEKDLSPEELDEMWEDVKEYARYKMEQRRRKNDKPSGAL